MSTINVDNINEYTSAGGVTIDGLLIKDGALPVGSTGLTKIAGSTFSAESSVSFDNVFSSTFRNYKVLIDTQNSANNTEFQLRFRDGSGDLTGSNYGIKAMYAVVSSNANNYTSGYNRTAQSFGVILAGMGANTPYGFYLDIWGPNLEEKTPYAGTGSNGNGHLFHSSGAYTVATALTGITFYQSSGTITGSIQIYGYKL